ncbi:MAG: 30S ribosomal protein S4 [Deltaproteobacteria bacterium]|nr:30S ribosomal protein S4 [Deltaproteobacteria bacterium]
MAKNIGAKVRLSRRVGIPITPKSIRIMERKPFKPGVHKGQKTKLSTYGQQLQELQKVKFFYNITRRQLKRYFETARRKKGNTVDNLFAILESRLDTILVRAGVCPTIYGAGQLVSHGHVFVNGSKVNVRSYQVKAGDIISLSDKAKKIPMVVESVKNYTPAKHLELNKENFEIKVLFIPKREEVPFDVEANQVVELLSRQ